MANECLDTCNERLVLLDNFNCTTGDHDWTWVEAWRDRPAHYYCAVCGYTEEAREVSRILITGITSG